MPLEAAIDWLYTTSTRVGSVTSLATDFSFYFLRVIMYNLFLVVDIISTFVNCAFGLCHGLSSLVFIIL